MISHPSYKEIMDKVNSSSPDGEKIINSRYSVVLGTAKRARQITAAEYLKIEEEKKAEKASSLNEKPIFRDARKKALSIAVEEFDNDKVHILQESSDNYETYISDEDGKR